MALIICPECGKEISSKASSCPNCGCPISIGESINESENIGAPINNDLETKNTIAEMQTNQTKAVNNPSKPKKGKMGLIIGIVFGLLVAVSGGFLYYQNEKKKAEEAAAEAARLEEEQKQKEINEFVDNFNEAYRLIVSNSITTEECGNMIYKVWSNTIFHTDDEETDPYTKQSTGEFYDDFNDAIAVLFADSSFSEKYQGIVEDKDKITDLLRMLTNPPEEYSKHYDLLEKMYNTHVDLVNCVSNPKGNLTQFYEKFSNADEEMLKAINALDPYMSN